MNRKKIISLLILCSAIVAGCNNTLSDNDKKDENKAYCDCLNKINIDEDSTYLILDSIYSSCVSLKSKNNINDSLSRSIEEGLTQKAINSTKKFLKQNKFATVTGDFQIEVLTFNDNTVEYSLRDLNAIEQMSGSAEYSVFYDSDGKLKLSIVWSEAKTEEFEILTRSDSRIKELLEKSILLKEKKKSTKEVYFLYGASNYYYN